MLKSLYWLLALFLLVGCAGKPPVDHTMHQFLYKLQTMDESLVKIGDDNLDVLIAYDEKHDRNGALAALGRLEDDWLSINSGCQSLKAPPGAEELVPLLQTRSQLVRKQLDCAKAYLQGINLAQNMKDLEGFATRLSADFTFAGKMRTLSKQANLQLTDKKKIPKP